MVFHCGRLDRDTPLSISSAEDESTKALKQKLQLQQQQHSSRSQRQQRQQPDVDSSESVGSATKMLSTIRTKSSKRSSAYSKEQIEQLIDLFPEISHIRGCLSSRNGNNSVEESREIDEDDDDSHLAQLFPEALAELVQILGSTKKVEAELFRRKEIREKEAQKAAEREQRQAAGVRFATNIKTVSSKDGSKNSRGNDPVMECLEGEALRRAGIAEQALANAKMARDKVQKLYQGLMSTTANTNLDDLSISANSTISTKTNASHLHASRVEQHDTRLPSHLSQTSKSSHQQSIDELAPNPSVGSISKERWEALRSEARVIITRRLLVGWKMTSASCKGDQCNHCPLLSKQNRVQCVVCGGAGSGTDGMYGPAPNIRQIPGSETDRPQPNDPEQEQHQQTRRYSYSSSSNNMPLPLIEEANTAEQSSLQTNDSLSEIMDEQQQNLHRPPSGDSEESTSDEEVLDEFELLLKQQQGDDQVVEEEQSRQPRNAAVYESQVFLDTSNESRCEHREDDNNNDKIPLLNAQEKSEILSDVKSFISKASAKHSRGTKSNVVQQVGHEILLKTAQGWSLIDASCQTCEMPLLIDPSKKRELCVFCEVGRVVKEDLEIRVERKNSSTEFSDMTETKYSKNILSNPKHVDSQGYAIAPPPNNVTITRAEEDHSPQSQRNAPNNPRELTMSPGFDQKSMFPFLKTNENEPHTTPQQSHSNTSHGSSVSLSSIQRSSTRSTNRASLSSQVPPRFTVQDLQHQEHYKVQATHPEAAAIDKSREPYRINHAPKYNSRNFQTREQDAVPPKVPSEPVIQESSVWHQDRTIYDRARQRIQKSHFPSVSDQSIPCEQKQSVLFEESKAAPDSTFRHLQQSWQHSSNPEYCQQPLMPNVDFQVDPSQAGHLPPQQNSLLESKIETYQFPPRPFIQTTATGGSLNQKNNTSISNSSPPMSSLPSQRRSLSELSPERRPLHIVEDPEQEDTPKYSNSASFTTEIPLRDAASSSCQKRGEEKKDDVIQCDLNCRSQSSPAGVMRKSTVGTQFISAIRPAESIHGNDPPEAYFSFYSASGRGLDPEVDEEKSETLLLMHSQAVSPRNVPTESNQKICRLISPKSNGHKGYSIIVPENFDFNDEKKLKELILAAKKQQAEKNEHQQASSVENFAKSHLLQSSVILPPSPIELAHMRKSAKRAKVASEDNILTSEDNIPTLEPESAATKSGVAPLEHSLANKSGVGALENTPQTNEASVVVASLKSGDHFSSQLLATDASAVLGAQSEKSKPGLEDGFCTRSVTNSPTSIAVASSQQLEPDASSKSSNRERIRSRTSNIDKSSIGYLDSLIQSIREPARAITRSEASQDERQSEKSKPGLEDGFCTQSVTNSPTSIAVASTQQLEPDAFSKSSNRERIRSRTSNIDKSSIGYLDSLIQSIREPARAITRSEASQDERIETRSDPPAFLASNEGKVRIAIDPDTDDEDADKDSHVREADEVLTEYGVAPDEDENENIYGPQPLVEIIQQQSPIWSQRHREQLPTIKLSFGGEIQHLSPFSGQRERKSKPKKSPVPEALVTKRSKKAKPSSDVASDKEHNENWDGSFHLAPRVQSPYFGDLSTIGRSRGLFISRAKDHSKFTSSDSRRHSADPEDHHQLHQIQLATANDSRSKSRTSRRYSLGGQVEKLRLHASSFGDRPHAPSFGEQEPSERGMHRVLSRSTQDAPERPNIAKGIKERENRLNCASSLSSRTSDDSQSKVERFEGRQRSDPFKFESTGRIAKVFSISSSTLTSWPARQENRPPRRYCEYSQRAPEDTRQRKKGRQRRSLDKHALRLFGSYSSWGTNEKTEDKNKTVFVGGPLEDKHRPPIEPTGSILSPASVGSDSTPFDEILNRCKYKLEQLSTDDESQRLSLPGTRMLSMATSRSKSDVIDLVSGSSFKGL